MSENGPNRVRLLPYRNQECIMSLVPRLPPACTATKNMKGASYFLSPRMQGGAWERGCEHATLLSMLSLDHRQTGKRLCFIPMRGESRENCGWTIKQGLA